MRSVTVSVVVKFESNSMQHWSNGKREQNFYHRLNSKIFEIIQNKSDIMSASLD